MEVLIKQEYTYSYIVLLVAVEIYMTTPNSNPIRLFYLWISSMHGYLIRVYYFNNLNDVGSL